MVENNKDLLDLEVKPAASSSLESKLFVCKKDKDKDGKKDGQKPTMSSLPRSQVLGKVKDFLGVFFESNKKLMEDAKERPESYDIEVLSGDESKYIEMDLMLGIADLHTPEAVAAAESAMAGCQKLNHSAESSCSDDDGDSSEEEDDDDDDDDDDDGDDEVREQETEAGSESGLKDDQRDSSCRESKKQKPKKRPKIVEVA